MDEDELRKAINAILNGKCIVYPTDTLYGLGAQVSNDQAITSIYNIKKRPLSLPLPIAVANMSMLKSCVHLTPLAIKLSHHFFPGKITLVCEKKDLISDRISSGKKTVAIRIPDDSIALSIIKKTGPLVSTSANIHGQKTPETISEIRKLFKPGIVEVFVDDGPRKGKPSTIVDVTGSHPKILRTGSIPENEILNGE